MRTAPMMLREMLQAELVRGDFTLASGRKSTYYLDGRQVTLTAKGAAHVGMTIMRELHGKPVAVHAIGGPETAAIPIVAACLALAAAWARADIIGFYTRSSVKDHGTGRLIEGPLKPGMNVALVDDVATSGGSLVKCARVVREFGAGVYAAFCVVDRLEGAAEALAAEGIPLHPLFTIRDLGISEEEQNPDGTRDIVR